MRASLIMSFIALCSSAPNAYDYSSQPVAITSYGAPSWIHQRVFVHSAAEEKGISVQHHNIAVGTPEQTHNVVFVQSPTENERKIRIRLIPAVNDEHTKIYVLSEEANPPLLENYVQNPITTTSKPEVTFIKYKTNEEAEHAQHQIVTEYDRLDGSNSVSHEGISPIKSVIGILNSLKWERGVNRAAIAANDIA